MIGSDWIEIEREGSPMRAYVSTPADANLATPTVVVAMHLYGIDATQRDAVNRFASDGFATVVPDLYARFDDVPDGDKVADYREFIPFAQRLDASSVDPDIRAAATWIRERYPQSKTAIAGFCMGGVMALQRTIGYTELFDAAAVWYGAIRIDPERVEIPIVASYGADDTGIPVASVEAFRERLNVQNDIVVYPNAGHAFCDSHRASYEKNAAEDSWRRSLQFLRRYLG